MIRIPLIALSAPIAALAPLATAQGTAEDYRRAEQLQLRWRVLEKSFDPAVQWLPDGAGVAWMEAGDPDVYVRVDARSGERKESADPAELGLPEGPIGLSPLARWRGSPGGGRRVDITFRNTFDRTVRVFWVTRRGGMRQYGEVEPGAERSINTYSGHVWVLDFAANDLAGIFAASAADGVAVIDEESRRVAMEGKRSVDDAAASVPLTVRNHNVVWTGDSGEARTLTDDGTAADPYRESFIPSPDGRFALGWQETVVETRRIPLVDVTPEDQLQPRLEWHRYGKPGDPMPRRRPRLFDLERGKAIAVADDAFSDALQVERVRWAADGERVFVHVVERGHQRAGVYGIDASTGRVRPVVEDRSTTFLDTSQKTYLDWLSDGRELLWASERDGNNHLYRIDVATGDVLHQVTKGGWRVRRVLRVDEAEGVVWLMAMGVRPDQSPYHRHLVRVGLDGEGLTVLTEGDGTHEITFSDDRSLFLDRWSRVDQPPVTELRRSRDGSLVAELGRDDVSDLLASGFAPPERFVAKGRDGETDIHGIVLKPSNFDPRRRYPVVEQIYAGPHDHHVPVRWGRQSGARRLAELGFVVVQIDGMGTNWRSKAFHDVCWQNLKDAGLPDRIAWMREAAKTRPWMDLTRVGIYGGSAGGQNALSAVLHHGDFYKSAAADCGCHDNRMDKTWWNEAWMGNLGPHYAENSNTTHAGKLQGDLMLTLGGMDRNVDPASTLQVVDALVRAGKDFDFVLDPSGGHGVGESGYMFRRRQDFFVRTLMGVEPRRVE